MRFPPSFHQANQLLALGLIIGWLAPVFAAGLDQDSPADTLPAQPVRRHQQAGQREDRLLVLAKALDLDARQQAELRKLLQDQHEQTVRIWSDTSVPAAYRISATQGLSEKTAEKIRALLTDEQKKKYNPPRRAHEADPNATRSVEEWMNAPSTPSATAAR